MDRSAQFNAETIVNIYSAENISEIIREYGEENWAARIAYIYSKCQKAKKDKQQQKNWLTS